MKKYRMVQTRNGVVVSDRVIEREPLTVASPAARPSYIELWKEFHAATLTDSFTREMLEDFSLRVDILNMCGCGKRWREIITAHPLPDSRQFEWGVDRHNDVNAKLGKPLISYESARKTWAI